MAIRSVRPTMPAAALQNRKTRSVFESLRRRVCKVVCCASRRPRNDRRPRRFLRVSSILPGATVHTARPFRPWDAQDETPERWHGSCPCCKRPMDLQLTEAGDTSWPPTVSARGRYAYVINLWGASAEYVLGALVLGHSIRNTGSPHARVCLFADDVPQAFVDLLSHLWDCRQVEHVEVAAIDRLSTAGKDHRFAKVFTKLRAMELVEFEKILVMDIDLLVLSSIDNLFELQAPAAMRRGQNDSHHALQTGDEIDGQFFFTGKDPSQWSWGQGTGINAGVMLWQPDLSVFAQMISELSSLNHPEHCLCNGPEQDYLSRFWADAPWHYIGSEYNYQLHQMFLSLHPRKREGAERVRLLDSWRDRVKVVHFSGDSTAKPWDRILQREQSDLFWPDRSKDAEYANWFSENFQGYHLWVQRDREWLETSKLWSTNKWELLDFELDEAGDMYRKPTEECAERVCVNLTEKTQQGVMGLMSGSLGLWFDAYQDLEKTLGVDLQQSLLATMAVAETERKESGEALRKAAQ